MTASLRIPRRFLRGSYARLVLTVTALAFGVALVCAMDLVNRAVRRAFVEVVDTVAGRAALQVSAAGPPFAENVAEIVAGVAGVELAVPVVSGTAFTVDGSGELLTVHGVEITNEAAVRIYEARDAGGLELDDPLVFLNQLDSIVVTRDFATRRGLHSGDPFDLITPTGRRSFTVRGLLEPRGIARAYGGNLIVMDLPAAQAAYVGPGLINRVDVIVRRGAPVADVAAAITRVLPAGLQVEAPNQRKADLHRVMDSLDVMLDAVSVVGLAAAFLIIFNRLTTVFEARAWQLGVFRAAGVRRAAIWRELLKESVMLGLAATVIGLPLGIAIGRLLLPVVATTAALNYKLIATEAELTLALHSFLAAAALGIGVAVLAAALPAWRIARLTPIETIRGHGTDLPRPSSWLLPAVTAGALAAALTAHYATRTPLWGLIATMLIIVAAALAARPLLLVVYPPLVGALRAIAGPSAWLARGSFARNTRRAALTAAMIGVGIGSIIWLRMLAYSFETSLVHALSGALQGDWVVASSHAVHGYLEAPVDDRLVSAVRAIAGVGDAVGERLVDWRYADGPIAIDAFDARYFDSNAFGRWPLVGAAQRDVWTAVRDGTAVLISSSLATNLGVAVGDAIELATPSGRLPLQVAGITVNFSSPRGTIVMSRDRYRSHWHDPQVTRVFVRVADGSDAMAVRGAIAQQLGPVYGVRIGSARDLLDYFASQVRRAFAPVDVLALLMLFVILIGLADTLAASVLERTRELGMIRALGIRRAVVGRAVVVEALALGVLGLLVALLAGLGLGAMWVGRTFPQLLGWALETYVPYAHLGLVCVSTLLVCALASLVPARHAAAMHPAVALRAE
jgi:putative ABC transport system permease protein